MKFIKKSFFVTLWLSCCYVTLNLAIASLEFTFFEFSHELILLNGFPIQDLPCSTTFFGVLCFMLLRLFSNFELYLFSYHVYTGKHNWYKFFNEREKAQKKENSFAYKEYLKSLKK